MTERLRIRMIGSQDDHEDLRLGDFIEALSAVRSALKHTERVVRGLHETSTYYRVVNLSHQSPSTIEIEPVARVEGDGDVREAQSTSDEVVRRFVGAMEAIVQQRRPAIADPHALASYRDVGDVLRRNVSSLVLETTAQRISIDQVFVGKVDKLMGKDEEIEGSVTGVLEKLNLHNASRFDIYPVVGPSHVSCEFPKELRDVVVAAVDKYVEVFGTLRYKELSPFPYAIKVKRVEIMPPIETLPTLASLRGIAPRATGDLSAAEFVYELRHES